MCYKKNNPFQTYWDKEFYIRFILNEVVMIKFLKKVEKLNLPTQLHFFVGFRGAVTIECG